jgi:IS30 family transposase
MTLVGKVPRKYADLVRDRIIDLLGDLRDWVLTLTLDNGTEFVEHAGMAKALGMDVYFARPYRSCDRGLNENTNGLIRQYFPKGTDFDQVSDEEIEQVNQKLNHRPRKCLGFKTPAEVFFAMVHKEMV